MKITKKSIFAMGAAVMVTASLALATFASAANVPDNTDVDEAPVAIELSDPVFVYDDGIIGYFITVVAD